MSDDPDVRLCIFCRRHPQASDWRPFCSERCKLQDLARWADGSYRIAAEPASTSDEDENRHTDHRKD